MPPSRRKTRSCHKGARPVQGRPFSEATEQAILRAVPSLIASRGYSRLTVDEIAREAGVGKAAIYRRWPTKADVVVRALSAAFSDANPEAPETGDARSDLKQLLLRLVGLLTKTPMGACLQSLVSEIPHDPILRELSRALERERRELLQDVLRRLGLDESQGDGVSLVLGPIYFRLFISGETLDRKFVDRLVDALFGRVDRECPAHGQEGSSLRKPRIER